MSDIRTPLPYGGQKLWKQLGASTDVGEAVVIYDSQGNVFASSTPSLGAQTITTAGAGGAVSFIVNGAAAIVGVVTSGVWSGTLQFDGSSDGGTTWQSNIPFTKGDGTLAIVFSSTANGNFIVPASGFSVIRARAAALASGTITLTFQGSPAYAPLYTTANDVADSAGNGLLAVGQALWDSANSLYRRQRGDANGQAQVIAAGYLTTPSANFTRPNDTTAYAVGDLVANSTTAGSVTPMSWAAARIAAGSAMIRRARLKKSGTTITNASFRLHLYGSDPSLSTGITNGDNGAWLTKIDTYLGAIDLTVDKVFSDASAGNGVPNIGSEINFALASGQTLYGLLEARAAYTPAAQEVFTADLEVFQN